MARLDWKRGRFSVDMETNEIEGAIRARQSVVGDTVDYYRYDRDDSQYDDLYGESVGVGRVYRGPITVAALHVIHEEGESEQRLEGFYTNDTLHVQAGFDSVRKLGFSEADIHTGNYLRDRIVYDGKVFRVTNMQILGQVQRRDIIIAIDATQVKPDELEGDDQFQKYIVTPD